MRYWIITSEFPPSFGGGIGTYVSHAARMLAHAGHEVTVLVRDEHRDAVETLEDGVRVVRFRHCQGPAYDCMGYWAALSYQYADEILDRIDADGASPDVIEMQDYNAIGYYALTRKYLGEKRLERTRMVVYLHTPTFETQRANQAPQYRLPEYWIGRMEQWTMRAADALIAPSRFLADRITAVIPDKSIAILPYPFQPAPSVPGEGNKYRSDVLYLGRFEHRKGVISLLEGIRRVAEQGRGFAMTLIGGDTYFEPKGVMLGQWLRTKYADLVSSGHLRFLPSVPPGELDRYVAGARFVTVPSLYENAPYTCIQSMSAGKPMLVSASGGQAEMVGDDGKCGLVFDWERVGDFEGKFTAMLDKDEGELSRMGACAKERISSLCSYERVLPRRLDHLAAIGSAGARVFPSSNPFPKRQAAPLGSVPGLLSIIIPFYNLGQYLEETLESALASDTTAKEIIIVDDGSTDDASLLALERIRSRGLPGVTIVTIANAGLANARNVGALGSRGEFITFLDADDLVDPTFYSRSLELLKRYGNVSLVYSWLEYFGAASGVWPTFPLETPYLLCANMLSAFAVVRRDDFLAFGRNRPGMVYGLEDYDGWIGMAEAGCNGIAIPEPLVRYRVRPRSMLRQISTRTRLFLLERLSDGHPEPYRRHAVEVAQLLSANGPGYLWNNPSLGHGEVGYLPSQAAPDDLAAASFRLPIFARMYTLFNRLMPSSGPLRKGIVTIAMRLGVDRILLRR